jgi:ABC-type branched-subunit amino acid transport system ATPase component/branched-subunit amino acid ABC-type transport system permease component
MTQELVFLLLGLANGAVFASLALALVMTYRSSGVINFATGAIALFTAYTYAFLRKGQLLILIPGLKQTVKIGGNLGFVPAAVLALLMAAVLGLILYVLIFRPLRTAPPIARAVASLGVMVVLTGVMLQRLGTSPVEVSSIFPTHNYKLGSVRVSGDRIWFAITVVAVTLVLAAAYRFTRFGLSTRAAAVSEKGAFVSGISPDRIAAYNWMISAAVAGLAGILIAPIVPLVPAAYTLFIVPALAAAIAGRFQSLAVGVGAGLVIGMVQSEVTYLQGQHSWLPKSGMAELVPLVLVLVVLVIQGRPLPGRGALITHTLGRAPRPRGLAVPAAIATAAAAVGLVAMSGAWRAALLTSLIFGIISLSLVVVTGYAGQVSLAQLTLAGAAGFLLSPLTASWGIPFPIAPLLAALGATVIGVIVGLPALRIRGLPVAVVTLTLAVALEALWFRNPSLVPSEGKNITGPSLFGLNLRVGAGTAYPRLAFCFVALAALVVAGLGVAKLRISRLGSAMLAVRANERSAAAAGINVVATKVAAFAIAAFIAGIGGTLLAYKQTNVTFDPFDAILGLSVFATAYLAGITSVSGGLLAGIMGVGGLTFLATDRWLSLTSDWYQVLTGIGLILTVVLNPEGIVGPWHTKIEEFRVRRRGAAKAPEVAEAGPRPALVALERPSPAPALLSLKEVSVHYGGVVAVDGVSFDVAEGNIVGLIGPNGAGKTTLIDAISGFAPASGEVLLAGVHIEHQKPHQRIRAGLGRTFQAIELWDDLSVEENVVVGLAAAAGRHTTASKEDLTQVFGLLGLTEVRNRPAGELSQGQRQLVSIARALVGRPKVLLLDEPAGGLDSTESLWLGERLRSIRDSGVTILLIDHDMHLVLNLCDQIQVLNFGRIIASGPPASIRGDRAVADAYLGSTHATTAAGTA